jgi:hypothetical protein
VSCGGKAEEVGQELILSSAKFFTLEENYQRKPAQGEPRHRGHLDSLLIIRHPRDLGCYRRLPPGAQIASNRFSYLRRLIEPRKTTEIRLSSLTALRVLGKETPTRSTQVEIQEERKARKHEDAMQNQ